MPEDAPNNYQLFGTVVGAAEGRETSCMCEHLNSPEDRIRCDKRIKGNFPSDLRLWKHN